MKTLNNIKDDIAIQNGYKNWNELLLKTINDGNVILMDILLPVISNAYAVQAIEKCAEEVTHSIQIDWVDPHDYSAGHHGITGDIDKKSILEVIKQLK